MKYSLKALIFFAFLIVNDSTSCQYLVPDNVYQALLTFYFEKGHLKTQDVEKFIKDGQKIADCFFVSEIIENENTHEVGLFIFSHRFFEHPETGFIFHNQNKYHIFDNMVFYELIGIILESENIDDKKKISWINEIIKTYRSYVSEKQNPIAVFNQNCCRIYIPANRLVE